MPDVRVPQKGGAITVARSGDDPTVRTVSQDGIVQVADQDLEHFVSVVPDAQLVEQKNK